MPLPRPSDYAFNSRSFGVRNDDLVRTEDDRTILASNHAFQSANELAVRCALSLDAFQYRLL
jgi:hypothetical protein